MNYQDLRYLQEAYLEIYEEGGTSDIVVKLKSPEERAKYQANLERRKKRKEEPSFWDKLGKRREEGLPSEIDIKRVVAAQNKKEQEKRFKKQSEEKERRERAAALKKEQVDIYDLILSHLLDEGYANTYEDAEVIFENMSEGWKRDLMKKVGKEVLKKAGQSIKKSKAYKNVKRFAISTTLGSLGVPLVS